MPKYWTLWPPCTVHPSAAACSRRWTFCNMLLLTSSWVATTTRRMYFLVLFCTFYLILPLSCLFSCPSSWSWLQNRIYVNLVLHSWNHILCLICLAMTLFWFCFPLLKSSIRFFFIFFKVCNGYRLPLTPFCPRPTLPITLA